MTHSFEKLLKKAAAYCSKSERCLSEVREKLIAWGASQEEIEGVSLRLIDDLFIDHRRYALFYTRDKFRFNGWGKIKIRLMLKQKGIESQAIDDAFEEIDEEEYLNKLSHLIANKTKEGVDTLSYEERSKLFRFAYGRGFEPHLINLLLRHSAFDE